LDIAASLYRANGSLLQTFNPADLTSASFSINLDAGTYFLGIDGVGAGNPFASSPTGYTDYGSLGQYMVSGSVQQVTEIIAPPPTPPPVTPPPGTLVIQSTGILTTSESGGRASFQLSLSRAPLQDVIVTLASTNPGEGVPLTSRFVFTAGDWATPQTVTIEGMDDGAVDGTVNYAITLSTSSSDPGFDQIQSTPVALQNLDNDVAASPTLFIASAGALKLAQNYITPPSVSGSLADISGSDDRRMAISEGTIALKRNQTGSDLNAYQWTFDNLIDARSLLFEGFRTANSVLDNFSIQFSTNNGKRWTTAFTVSNSTESLFSHDLGSSVNGTVLVRAIDTNSNSNSRDGNTLYVDQLVFSSASSATGSKGKAPEADPIIGSALGSGACCDPAPVGWMENPPGTLVDVAPHDLQTASSMVLLPGSTNNGPFTETTDPLSVWHAGPTGLI
ncbi:hypothetical protein, partial [Synechococcus sp. CCY 9618]|uniref:hypothetical protein n=1 Tax=Synechococcus sp. CCY 9618 TaxID=2815602 RepID=UPI001C21FA15